LNRRRRSRRNRVAKCPRRLVSGSPSLPAPTSLTTTSLSAGDDAEALRLRERGRHEDGERPRRRRINNIIIIIASRLPMTCVGSPPPPPST